MTIDDSVELLFRCRLEGKQDIDSLAASVQGVSAASATANTSLSGLEAAVKELTAAVIENTEALDAMEGGVTRVGTGLSTMGVGARAASNELRVLEGAMPIRAAAQFLTQIQGISAVMQVAFPIFGAIALVGVLDTILSKAGLMPGQWDETTEAQKRGLDELEKQSKKYDELIRKSKHLADVEFERAHGRDAGRLRQAGEATFAAGSAAIDATRVQQEIEVLRKLADPWHSGPNGGAFIPSERDAFLANMAGMGGKSTLWGLGNTSVQAGVFGNRTAELAKALLPGLERELSAIRQEMDNDQREANAGFGGVAFDNKKKADEDAKKRQHELAEAEKQAAAYLRQAQTFELTSLERINAAYKEKLDLLGKTKKAIEDINAAHKLEVSGEVNRIIKTNMQYLGGYVDDLEQQGLQEDKYGSKVFLENLHAQMRQDSKDQEAAYKIAQFGDDADANAVQRSLGVTLRNNSLAVGAGRQTGTGAAAGDYTARVQAARDIFRIETQHLDLIAEEDKRDEAYANARKKRDEEIYRAAEQYEIKLAELRERDLQKYQELAGSLFDAMRNHSTGQFGRDFVLGQARQVFSNATAPLLQQAGHVLGGLIPNVGPLGGILHGTVFDAANKGVPAAEKTANETKRTADEVHALRSDIRALTGAPAASGSADGGSGISLPGAAGGAPGGVLSSIFGGGASGGIGSALFRAGDKSTFGQFMSGLGGLGSNPLGAVFGGWSTNGDTETQLTGAQRVGAGVGLGAALAGGALGIYSGIHQGGAAGGLRAGSSALGMAALLDPEPISKAVLGIGAAVTGLLSGLFGTGPQKRQQDIAQALAAGQYIAPTAFNVIQGMNGTYEDFDARGNVRTSNLSALPTVAEPYIWKQTHGIFGGPPTYYDVPGGVVSPYSGSATGTGTAPVPGTTVVNITALDTQSFSDFMRRPVNAHTVGETLADHLERHDGRAANAIRFVAGN